MSAGNPFLEMFERMAAEDRAEGVARRTLDRVRYGTCELCCEIKYPGSLSPRYCFRCTLEQHQLFPSPDEA